MAGQTIQINRFDGGILNDPRTPLENAAKMIEGFDAVTDPYRLMPYHDSEDGNASQTTLKIRNYAIALRTGTTYSLYGLGVTSGTGVAEVYYKNLTTGAANDLDDANWTETTNNASSTGAVNYNLFVYYERTGLIYGARAGSNIWAYDPTGSASWADSHQALSYTNIAQGLVHSKDDILYIPYDNKIAKNNNGSWTTTALTLPANLYITSICEYGNYLAIAATPLSGLGENVVYLWNRDDSLTTLSQRISWGTEVLKVLDVVDGELVGISLGGGISSRLTDRIVFRRYVGGDQQQKFMEFLGEDTSSTTLAIAKQVHDSRLHFMMGIKLNGTQKAGVWSIGRASPTQPLGVIHERPIDDNVALVTPVLYNFHYANDFLFQSFNNNSTEQMTKTNDDSTSYTASAIYETLINPKMPLEHRWMKKELFSIGVTFEPLASGESVVLKYRVDSNGSWTTVATFDTDGEVRGEATDASGSQFSPGVEYEFRVESTGGAVITGLEYRYGIQNTNL